MKSECKNSKPYPYNRKNNTCIGKSNCLETCKCATAYELGIETEVEQSEASRSGVFVLFIAIGVFMICLFFAFVHRKQPQAFSKVSYFARKCKKMDDFDIKCCLEYLFQMWDFFSDVLLSMDIFDHYYQVCMLYVFNLISNWCLCICTVWCDSV